MDTPTSRHLPIVPLERDVFLRTLIRHLAGSLQEVVGLREASGFISLVGQRMGDEIGNMYRAALQTPALTARQVAEVCVVLVSQGVKAAPLSETYTL